MKTVKILDWEAIKNAGFRLYLRPTESEPWEQS